MDSNFVHTFYQGMDKAIKAMLVLYSSQCLNPLRSIALSFFPKVTETKSHSYLLLLGGAIKVITKKLVYG